MTATIEDVDARWHEIANDPQMKLTAEGRLEVGLMREACKWARKYIRDPGACKTMTSEQYAEFLKKDDPAPVEPSWEEKYRQLSTEFDLELRQKGRERVELQQEHFALKNTVARLEEQHVEKSRELALIKLRVKDACGEWKRNAYQMEVRDVLIDKLFEERAQLNAELAASRAGLKDVMGFLDGVHDIIEALRESMGRQMLFAESPVGIDAPNETQALVVFQGDALSGDGQTKKRKRCTPSCKE